MRKCIYCKKNKEDHEFSLEHVIPQFLGGAQAPDELKTHDVCKICNNNLGLFVDASFEKDFLVFNQLNESAYSLFDPDNPTSLPLRNMGISDLIPPGMENDEVCESWLGPLGEQVFWVRPTDEKLYWYTGGNPRTAKSVKTKAYFLCAERSAKNILLTWISFRDAFIGRKIKKIMCTQIEGANPETIGFSAPDELDSIRIEYFHKMCESGQRRHNKLAMNVQSDYRFIAKLAIGIAYTLLGESFLSSDYYEELYKALWFKEGDPEPEMQGQSNYGNNDDIFKRMCGVKNGVTITILPVHPYIAINININQKMNWTVNCAKVDKINIDKIQKISNGLCIILFRPIKKVVTLTLPELIAYRTGTFKHPELDAVDKLADVHKDYFKNL